MRQENGGGDRLASGAARASFRTANSKITAEKWAAIWDDYEPQQPKVEQNKDEKDLEQKA